MMSRRKAVVTSADTKDYWTGIQRITTEFGPAINYTDLADEVGVGDTVLLNCTATDLNLGTGGHDFVIARLVPPPTDTPPAERKTAHLMKLRYTPLQHSSRHIEERPDFKECTAQKLDGFPVVAGELHSQLAPFAAAVSLSGNVARYGMTDSAALPLSLSELVATLVRKQLLIDPICIGQAFGSNQNLDFTAITLHSALLYWKRLAYAPTAFVSQGPGNTGAGVKYGFSGIEQASNLDTVAALGGTPIACVRASSADPRERHRGISHHTTTVLELIRSRCIVPLPEGLDAPAEWMEKHEVVSVPRERTQRVLDHLKERGIDVTTMGRTIDQDPLFFHAAAAAGIIAGDRAAAT